MPSTHKNDSREWKATRLRILSRDEYTCQMCGLHDPSGRDLHIDHIHPKSAGGSDDEDNLRVLCTEHNLKKGAKTAQQRVTWFNPRWLERI